MSGRISRRCRTFSQRGRNFFREYKNNQANSWWDLDLMYLQLSRFPAGTDMGKIPRWPEFRIDGSLPSYIVGCLSLSGTVRGHGLAPFLRGHSSAARIFMFVEDSGEGGNSGTLMYNVSVSPNRPIGVYLGFYRPGGNDLKYLGRIRGLPSFDELQCHDVVNPPYNATGGPRTFHLRNIERQNERKTYQNRPEKGAQRFYQIHGTSTLYGVFIDWKI